jgi:hypothetical protein
MMINTRETVSAVVAMLEQSGAACDLFGGWAEELLSLREPSPHGDIDLVYRGENFKHLDAVIEAIPDAVEVPLKRFRHKRAFHVFGTLCEIMLVQEFEERPITLFWGDVPFAWDVPFLHGSLIQIGEQPITVVSAANLQRYRHHHAQTQPHRWRDPQSLEP